jgi:hypothetical protein
MDEEVDVYADPDITSGHAKIDGWLKFFYIVLPIWGVIWLFLYWNGSHGWLDRGYWHQLEKAANTMFPLSNYNDPKSH